LGLNKSKPSVKVGWFLSELAWRTERIKCSFSGRNPLITKETARAAHEKKEYSNGKLKAALNYSFITVEQSIKDTCKLFLKDLNAN
jgi:dihydroflavonol-4-reductase